MSKADYLKLGDWNAICDRCGEKLKASKLQKTWDNYWVCRGCWEPRHEQDFIRGRKDDTSVPWSRPEGADSGGTDINGSAFPPTPVYTPDPVPDGTFNSNNEDLDRSDE